MNSLLKISKKLLFCFVSLIFCVFVYADITELHPGLTLETSNDAYYIYFEAQEYYIEMDTLTNGIYEEVFSSIKFSDDYFDHLDENGMPSLPFCALDLVLHPMIDNFSATVNIFEVDTIHLPYAYTPAQTLPIQDSAIFCSVYYMGCNDTLWYSWDDHDAFLYTLGNYKGINFAFYPVSYDFYSQTVKIVRSAMISISFSSSYVQPNGINIGEYMRNLTGGDRIALNYFDNFIQGGRGYEIRPIVDDNYLIITTSQFANNSDLQHFINYKWFLGYNVEIVTTSSIGVAPDDIRRYIRNWFYGNGSGLSFVLIVGDVTSIPFSMGENGNDDNPPTDIFYGCLDEEYLSDQWYDLTPDVYVGRWPVSTDDELGKIIEKTMSTEEQMGQYAPNRIAIFSGSGQYEDYFYRDCRYFYDNVVLGFCDDGNNCYYSGDLFDGRTLESSGFAVFKAEMEGMHQDWPWMIIYDGHGSPGAFGPPFNVNTADVIDDIHTEDAPFRAFGFGFACNLGNIYSDDNIARTWLTSSNGGVTFLGATTRSYLEPDRYMSRRIFNQLECKPIMTMGEFVANGISKYYNAFRAVWRRREAKKYVFYGDPSIYLYGLDFVNRTPYDKKRYMAHNIDQLIINDKEIVFNSTDDSDTPIIHVYSVLGQVVLTKYGSNLSISGLPSGTFFVVAKTSHHVISKKFYIK